MISTSHDGAAIAWQSFGTGSAPTIVVMHSLGSSGAMWKPQISALADDFRIIAIDTRGHGRSSATTGDYSIDQLGHDVLTVVGDAAVDEFHAVGLSLGGQMAMWLALNTPDRVRSLVLSNTAAKIGSTDSWQSRIDAVTSDGMASIRDAVLARWFTAAFPDEQPERLAEMQQVFVTTDPVGYAGCCAALRDSDLRASVQEIAAPTLVIGGALDLATPPAEAEWLHQHIADSQLTIFDDAAHLSNVERAEAFTTRLRAFLPA